MIHDVQKVSTPKYNIRDKAFLVKFYSWYRADNWHTSKNNISQHWIIIFWHQLAKLKKYFWSRCPDKTATIGTWKSKGWKLAAQDNRDCRGHQRGQLSIGVCQFWWQIDRIFLEHISSKRIISCLVKKFKTLYQNL